MSYERNGVRQLANANKTSSCWQFRSSPVPQSSIRLNTISTRQSMTSGLPVCVGWLIFRAKGWQANMRIRQWRDR